jgi:hypothetical protein
MEPDPATAVAAPPHVLIKPLGVATTIPEGKVSTIATPVSVTAFAAGFAIVRVNVEFVFNGISEGLKILVTEGGATATTTMLADAGPPESPSVEVMFPVVLFLVPTVVPMMFIEKVQEVF